MEIMENWSSVEHETRMGQSVSFFANKNVSQVFHSWLFTRSSSYYVKRNPENHKSGSQSLSDFGIFAVTLLEFPNSEKYGVPESGQRQRYDRMEKNATCLIEPFSLNSVHNMF